MKVRVITSDPVSSCYPVYLSSLLTDLLFPIETAQTSLMVSRRPLPTVPVSRRLKTHREAERP
jgi:hypothetical protein